MAKYFGQDLTDEGDPPSPSPAATAGMEPLRESRAQAVMRAQDRVVTQSRRILARVSIEGDSEWLVPNTNPGTSPDTHPHVDEARGIARVKVDLTPGCMLYATCLHLPSGTTQVDSTNAIDAGIQGRVEFVTTWADADGSTETATYELSLDASTFIFGSEITSEGGMQQSYRLNAARFFPPVDLNDQAQRNRWRVASVDVLIRYVGSPRVVDLTLSERPSFLVMEADDDDDEWTSHLTGDLGNAMPSTIYPRDEREDTTASDADQRLGTRNIALAAQNQRKRLGATLFQWTPYTESGVSHGATEIPAVNFGVQRTVTWVNAVNTSQSASTSPDAYDADEPGWATGCAGYSRQWLHNNPQSMPDSNTAAVGVLFRVYAESSATTEDTRLRLHTTDYSWVDLTVPAASGPGWFEGWGMLTVPRNPETHLPAQVFVEPRDSDMDMDLYAMEAYVWDGSFGPAG